MNINIKWTVNSNKVDKKAVKLSEKVMLLLKLLFMDLATNGPAVPDWPNYGKLHGQKGISGTVIYRKANLPMFVAGR